MSADLLNRVEALEQQMARREQVFRKLDADARRLLSMTVPRQINAMTVDVEDYFQVQAFCQLC